MDYSTPGFPVHYQLPELAQTHVHWVSDAIQPSPPLLPLSPPALNLSQHQGLFQWVSSSHEHLLNTCGVTDTLRHIVGMLQAHSGMLKACYRHTKTCYRHVTGVRTAATETWDSWVDRHPPSVPCCSRQPRDSAWGQCGRTLRKDSIIDHFWEVSAPGVLQLRQPLDLSRFPHDGAYVCLIDFPLIPSTERAYSCVLWSVETLQPLKAWSSAQNIPMFSTTFQQMDGVSGYEPTSKADVIGSEKPSHVSRSISTNISLACPRMR